MIILYTGWLDSFSDTSSTLCSQRFARSCLPPLTGLQRAGKDQQLNDGIRCELLRIPRTLVPWGSSFAMRLSGWLVSRRDARQHRNCQLVSLRICVSVQWAGRSRLASMRLASLCATRFTLTSRESCCRPSEASASEGKEREQHDVHIRNKRAPLTVQVDVWCDAECCSFPRTVGVTSPRVAGPRPPWRRARTRLDTPPGKG